MFKSLATRVLRPSSLIPNRAFGIKLNSVKPEERSHCCDDPTHNHGAQPAEAPKKTVCDPYGQDGKPYDTATVKREMLGLDDGWTYNEEKKIMSKSFKFHKKFSPEDKPMPPPPVIPGKPVGPIYGPSACYTFAQHINNLCVNCDHWIYNMTITPRKAEVNVELKTLVRGGLTSNDFYLAMHMDALMHTTFRQ